MTVHQDVMIERTEDLQGFIYTVMVTQPLTSTLKHIVSHGTFESFEEAQDYADTLIQD
jgi:hypothetical protein